MSIRISNNLLWWVHYRYVKHLHNHQIVFLTHTSCVGNYIIVTTGLLYESGRHTEIVDLNDSSFYCTGLPDFPIDVVYAAGGIVNGIPIICGGANSIIYENNTEIFQTKNKQCYKFHNREWKLMKNISLDEPKFYFGTGINLVIKDKFLIHGGLTEDIQDKFFSFADASEWIGNDSHVSPKDTFPLPVGGHCNIRINETYFMVTGGLVPHGRNASVVTNKTYFCQMDMKKCSRGPDLNCPRRAHGCFQKNISGKQYLYVTGGYKSNSFTSEDVEYLDMSDRSNRQWKFGESHFCRKIQS